MVALYLNVSLLKSNIWRKVNNKQPQTLFLPHSLDSVLSSCICMRGKYLEDLPPITRNHLLHKSQSQKPYFRLRTMFLTVWSQPVT